MSRSSRRRILLISALFACCVPAVTGATGPDDYTARAKQFLRTLYPGLPRVRAVIYDETDLGGRPANPDVITPLVIQLYPSPHQAVVVGQPPPSQDIVLAARFDFDLETHDLRRVWVSGPFVDGRQEKLMKEVDAHPEWSDEQVVKALKAAGARFGPDDREAFLRALPLKELEPFTGRLEVRSVYFNLRLVLDAEKSAVLGGALGQPGTAPMAGLRRIEF
jgi:hypothetical protein